MPLTLADLPLEELLPSLADRVATGTLSVTTPRYRKKLYLVDGRLAGIRTSGHLVPRLSRTGLDTALVLRPGEAFVLSRVNDRWSLDEIARITPVSNLEFGVIVDTLQRSGLVELRAPTSGPTGR
ncbi:MAG: hypothetical protein HY825_10940 [Acidobacteria bacterium]|nr:hypothetical protein [Acidobacteriota bacterium]